MRDWLLSGLWLLGFGIAVLLAKPIGYWFADRAIRKRNK